MSLCSLWTDKHDQAIGHLLQMLKVCAKKCRGWGLLILDLGGPLKHISQDSLGGFFWCSPACISESLWSGAVYNVTWKAYTENVFGGLESICWLQLSLSLAAKVCNIEARMKFFYLIFQTDVYWICTLKVMYVLLQLFYTTFWIGWIKQGSLHDLKFCLVLFKVTCVGTPKSERQITYACNTFCSCIGTGQFW